MPLPVTNLETGRQTRSCSQPTPTRLSVETAREADELATLAKRANAEHEAGEIATRKSRDQYCNSLNHYRASGEALIAAREKCRRRGEKWTQWYGENIRFSKTQIYRYIEWANFPSTGNFEEDAAEWRRISDNAPPAVVESDGQDEADDKKSNPRLLTSDDPASDVTLELHDIPNEGGPIFHNADAERRTPKKNVKRRQRKTKPEPNLDYKRKGETQASPDFLDLTLRFRPPSCVKEFERWVENEMKRLGLPASFVSPIAVETANVVYEVFRQRAQQVAEEVNCG
jgi:hypothetical protein